MKTLFYFSRSTIPSRFANAIHVVKMCNKFSVLMDHVYLYCKSNKIQRPEGVGIFYGLNPLPFELIYYEGNESNVLQSLKYTLNGIWHLIKLKPEIVLTRHNWLIPFMPFLNGNTVFIVELHAPPNWLTSFFMKRYIAMGIINQVVVISQALKKLVVEKIGFVEHVINVLHDGADIYTNDSVEKGNKTNKISVAYAGHLYSGRGIEIIIDLAKHFNEIIFDVYGGDQNNIDYYKENSKHLKNILFHGFVEPGDVINKLSNADFLIAPYQTKVFLKNGMDTSEYMSPLKIFEYMSLGKPILCSKLPVLEEVLIHKQNALLCKADELKDWIENLTLLLDDSELRNRISHNARTDLSTKYSWTSRSQSILKFIERQKSI
jgi:glycosyltransferase involved in cell wall biosynthesis